MGFGKPYFDLVTELRDKYLRIYSCGFVTLTLRVYGQEYNLVNILAYDENLVTFCYYSIEKSRKLLEKIKVRTGESTAWPALTVPYEAIQSAEINPSEGKIEIVEIRGEKRQIGFFQASARETNSNGNTKLSIKSQPTSY